MRQRQRDRETERETETERERQRQRDRDRERQREREKETERQRQRERQADRQTQTQTQRQRQSDQLTGGGIEADTANGLSVGPPAPHLVTAVTALHLPVTLQTLLDAHGLVVAHEHPSLLALGQVEVFRRAW